MTPVALERPRTVHVEHCMGTVFTIDIRDAGPWGEAIGDVVEWLHHVDAVFSTYKHESDVNRIRRGELVAEEADPEVGPMLDLCERIEAETGGYFSARDGAGLDPTGLVKGWAIEAASRLLRARGSRNHAVNGGGDIQTAGEAAPGELWTIGVVDPLDPTRLLTVVDGRDFAVATSGVAERGSHIVDPHTGAPAEDLASVTVVGRSLTRVDAYATAAFAMGPDGCRWVEGLPGYDALFVLPDGSTASTARFYEPVVPPLVRRFSVSA